MSENLLRCRGFNGVEKVDVDARSIMDSIAEIQEKGIGGEELKMVCGSSTKTQFVILMCIKS